MSKLGSLLVLNIGMQCTITINNDLVFAGRIAVVKVTEDRIELTNSLGAIYYIDSVMRTIVEEPEIHAWHTDGTVSVISIIG